MTVKIDLEKAYDRLSSCFIRDTLQRLHLPPSWVQNIMQCVETTRMAIVWNGEQLQWFKPTRGIRQGDTISPYLFVLCMERLGHIIKSKVNTGRWKPIQLSRTGPHLSHLFFANDLVLFVEAFVDQARIIKHCLDRFCGSKGELPKIKHIFLQKSHESRNRGNSAKVRDHPYCKFGPMPWYPVNSRPCQHKPISEPA